MTKEQKKKIIIGISGASGAIYGIRALEMLKSFSEVETHLIISKAAVITINHETSYKLEDVIGLADQYYLISDIGASIASGSFKTHSMLIAPCSIKTMSEIACGITSNLMSRAADVVLKENKKLVLMLRETPLHFGHLSNLTKLSQIGAIIAPPVPAFYTLPRNIDDIINHSVARCLDILGFEVDVLKRWQGLKQSNL